MQLVNVWLEDLDLEGQLAPSTRELYEREMRQLVLPAFEHLTLREITVGRVDRFLKLQAAKSHSRGKHSKVVLSLAFSVAVRYEAISRNPVRETSRLRKPASSAMALTVTQVEAIRKQCTTGDGVKGFRALHALHGSDVGTESSTIKCSVVRL